MHWRLEELVELGFPRMHTILPKGEIGRVKLEHKTRKEEVGSGVMEMMAMMLMSGAPLSACDPAKDVPPGKYVFLMVNDKLMMSDTPYELESNRDFLLQASGPVLIAGLGMGVTLIPVARKKEVTSVVVVERDQDIIDLVWPHMPEDVKSKVTLVKGDIHEWEWTRKGFFDTVWLDIWPDISVAYLPEMTKLRRRVKPWTAPGAWIGIWGRERARRARREELEMIAEHGYSASDMPVGVDPVTALMEADRRREEARQAGGRS
jgi:hypothetical protein